MSINTVINTIKTVNIKTHIKRGLSISTLLSILALSTGCSSIGLQNGQRVPWDPVPPFSYGDRIPNMEGDYDRFCRQEPWLCG